MVAALLATLVLGGTLEATPLKFMPDATHMALGDGATGVYDPIDIYFVPGGIGIAFLLPLLPTPLPTGGTSGGFIDYRGILGGEFPLGPTGWSFATAGAALADDSLIMTSYDVVGSAGLVGIDGTATTSGVSVRVPNDKAPAGSAHWIQVIRDNHALPQPPNGHGTEDHKVDRRLNSPYYDNGYLADSRNFFDNPRRNDGTNSHYWIADLHLVTGPAPNAPGPVTIYDGLRYGWGNVVFPGIFRDLHTWYHTNFNNDGLSALLGVDLEEQGYVFDDTMYEDEFHEDFEAIPEPATLILTIVAGFMVVGRRSRDVLAGRLV